MTGVRQMFGGARSIVKGLGVTLSYLFKKKVTLQYPEERPVLTERFRGIPALPIDPVTGRDKCIACSACARVCPDQVIVITVDVGEDKKRRAGEFSIDAAGCIFCGLCVEVCPTGALVMSDEFELAHSSRADLVLPIAKLHEIGGLFPEKPAEAQEPAPTPKPAPSAATEQKTAAHDTSATADQQITAPEPPVASSPASSDTPEASKTLQSEAGS